MESFNFTRWCRGYWLERPLCSLKTDLDYLSLTRRPKRSLHCLLVEVPSQVNEQVPHKRLKNC